MIQTRIERMQELVSLIRKADEAYYEHDTEIMSNKEYDRLCEELEDLEKETGIRFAKSPSVTVSGKASDRLEKQTHEKPMLSLDKTKDRDKLLKWLTSHEGREGVLSWKLDGLTIVCTYDEGRLVSAVTRGTGGITGEVVTQNAMFFENLPLTIPYKEKLVIRGEAVISYKDFDRINKALPDEEQYKNPRNLASGSVRLLDPSLVPARHVRFIAFELVNTKDGDRLNDTLNFLNTLGFETVERVLITEPGQLKDSIATFEYLIRDNLYPSDGLVLALNDLTYAKSLGTTSKYPLGTMAFKWKDETVETTLRKIIWSPSRTGRINPVAVFDPVELEDTTVEKASVHNLSFMDGLKLGMGDTVSVYKANKIIPQIYESITKKNDWRNTMYCHECPACGTPTEERTSNADGTLTVTLHCPNPACPAKSLTHISHMACKDALDIRGLSDATLDKFIDAGLILEWKDLFELETKFNEIAKLEKMGAKSAENIVNAARKSSHTTPDRLMYGLGIALIGRTQSKEITAIYSDPHDWENLTTAQLCAIEGIGTNRAICFTNWFSAKENLDEFHGLLGKLTFTVKDRTDVSASLSGCTYVITGTLGKVTRKGLTELIEDRGGKVAGSVSKATTALINNDTKSQSSKNVTAMKLGIPIVSEEEFLTLIL